MTEDEAKTEAAVKNSLLGFCPLMNAACNPRCVCYGNSSVHNYYKKEDTFEVRGPYCNNYSITGPD